MEDITQADFWALKDPEILHALGKTTAVRLASAHDLAEIALSKGPCELKGKLIRIAALHLKDQNKAVNELPVIMARTIDGYAATRLLHAENQLGPQGSINKTWLVNATAMNARYGPTRAEKRWLMEEMTALLDANRLDRFAHGSLHSLIEGRSLPYGQGPMLPVRAMAMDPKRQVEQIAENIRWPISVVKRASRTYYESTGNSLMKLLHDMLVHMSETAQCAECMDWENHVPPEAVNCIPLAKDINTATAVRAIEWTRSIIFELADPCTMRTIGRRASLTIEPIWRIACPAKVWSNLRAARTRRFNRSFVDSIDEKRAHDYKNMLDPESENLLPLVNNFSCSVATKLTKNQGATLQPCEPDARNTQRRCHRLPPKSHSAAGARQ